LAKLRLNTARRPERPSGPIDSTVLFVVVTLVLIGVTLVYATTCHKGVAFLKSQGLRAGAGLLALFLGAKFRYTLWNGKIKWVVLVGSVAVLVLTLVIGAVFKGAQRWIQLGPLMFQPAEFAKFALLVWLAGYFDSLKELGKDQHAFWGFLVPGTVVLAVVGLTLLQPAVGTSFILAVVSLALFAIVGVKWWRLAVTLGVGVGGPNSGSESTVSRSSLSSPLVRAAHSGGAWARADRSSSSCRRCTTTSSSPKSARSSGSSAARPSACYT
jgi:cell division protein FtsW (lipid II flippase)